MRTERRTKFKTKDRAAEQQKSMTKPKARSIRLPLAECLILSCSACAFIDGPTFRNIRPRVCSSLHADNSNGRIVIADDVASPAPDRNVQEMQHWAFQRCGIQTSDGLDLMGSETDTASSTGIDYSIITNTDLPAGSPVVRVPAEIILSSNKAGQEFGMILSDGEQQLANAGLAHQVPLFRLFVKILVEYEKGTQSPYYPWLESLPRRFNNGSSMSYACFDTLPPYAAWLSSNERTTYKNFHRVLLTIGGDMISKKTKASKMIVLWAYNIATTRSTEMNGEHLIAPLVDYFNHGGDPEAEISFDQDGSCMVYAIKDVSAGSPLRISYGDPRDPSPLFARYGFLDKTAPASFCKLMDLHKEMEELGLSFVDLLFYKDTGDVSAEVYDLLLYDILSKDDDPSLRARFKDACLAGDAATKASFHQQYFTSTFGKLKAHVNDTLLELEKSKEVAEFWEDAPRRSRHPRLPVIMAHNDFVRQTFERVKANLDQMG